MKQSEILEQTVRNARPPAFGGKIGAVILPAC
jgi:hypothetical protein